MPIETINPATGARLRSYSETTPDAVETILKESSNAFQEWRRVDFAERASLLRSAAKLLRERRDDYARLMTEEMGKPITQSRSEVEKCATAFDFYAESGTRFLAPEQVPTGTASSFVIFQPLGTLLAIMPWNFPFWQAMRCAAPALMAGNAIVLKHASNVSGCALAIEAVLRDAGFPQGLFRTLLLGSARAEALIDHPIIRAVTLTGSVPAGRAIAARAGSRLKKTVLELGGSDPYIALEDCDLDRAVEACVKSRLINSGQSCVAAKRFIVIESILNEFKERFIARIEKEKVGDPMDDSTTVGPLARKDLRDELHSQVERSVAGGARVVSGGAIPEGAGWFFPPTVLCDVRPGIAAFDEETFGPVAAIIRARDEADAVRLANLSPFGLGAAVFTGDLKRGERIAAMELEAGNCFVNGQVRSDPRLPFGGVKDSGYGRELGIFGIREFVNIKTVVVDRAVK